MLLTNRNGVNRPTRRSSSCDCDDHHNHYDWHLYAIGNVTLSERRFVIFTIRSALKVAVIIY